MQITVSELFVRYLERLGIRVIFGMPGAHVLPLYDRLRASSVATVLVKHEQGAAFMAGGYARYADLPSACIATSGPGATNLVTGIANAQAEGLPVLAITGETSTYIFGKGGLQESSGEGGAIDQMALFAGITRYRRLVERTDYLGQVLNQASQALLGPQPGPVLLSVPYNVQKEAVDDAALDQVHAPAGQAPVASLPVDELARLLATARRPVCVAGHGCIRAGARELVGRLAEALAMPVATSLKGKGVVPEGSRLSLGCLGVTSDGAAYRHIVEQADLVLFLGAGFNERTSHLWDPRLLAGKKVAQVDRDPRQLGRVFRPDVAVLGDLAQVLEALLDRLEPTSPTVSDRPAAPPPGRPAVPADPRFGLIAAFYDRLARQFPRDALIFDDNIVLAQSYLWVSQANHYFPNTGISSLGHAIPAAIGAGFHLRERGLRAPVFAVLGDGGFQMCALELMTAVNYRLPLNVVLINNGSMSLIRKNQFQLYGGRYIDCDFVNPDFALLARSFGVAHWLVADPEGLDRLFAEADLVGGLNLIEIPLDKDAFPRYLADR